MQTPDHIHMIQTPVPYPLKSVNCYLCETDSGWSLIDTGCNTKDTQLFWKQIFQKYGISGGRLSDIYITHYHPDHLGLAGWMQQEYGAQVHMHEPDWQWAHAQWGDVQEQARLVQELFIQNGCPQDLASLVGEQFIQQCEDTVPLPDKVIPLNLREKISLGESEYEVVELPGHADHMIGFWNTKQKIFISADSILPHITPNVGIWPRCSTNPLKDFLETLGKIDQWQPLVTLPGHGSVMSGTSSRAASIRDHHQKRLRDMYALVEANAYTVYEIALIYFRLNQLSPHQARFALSETLAHLEYLMFEGRLDKKRIQGIDHYAPVKIYCRS